MKIGAQFYTIRDFCKTQDDLKESLKKVADIGYKYVQISGTCNYDPLWLKKQLDENGLKCVITHIPVDRLKNDLENVISEHNIIECKHIGLGWNKFEENECGNQIDEFIKTYKPITQKLKSNGKLFMYHNHGMEFFKYNDKVVLEHLKDNFEADELGFTLDTYWVQVGGANPAEYLEKLKGRVPCIHLKDYAYDRKMAVLGEGNINFDKVFEKAKYAGTKYMLVEQDECNGENPFDCLKRSYKFLKSRGFE